MQDVAEQPVKAKLSSVEGCEDDSDEERGNEGSEGGWTGTGEEDLVQNWDSS